VATAVETYPWDGPAGDLSKDLRVFLGMAEDDVTRDPLLQQLQEVAAQDCDDFVDWDWTDADGVDVTHKNTVWFGIKSWVRAFLGWYDANATPGVKEVKTGPFGEKYTGGDGGVQGVFEARKQAYGFWWSSKPILFGASAMP
jgi:hypothetical protein